MTRAEFINANPILDVLSARGIAVKGRMAKCQFHEDKNASMSVDPVKGVFHCHACKAGGSVIDLLAKLENKETIDYIKERGINGDTHHAPAPQQKAVPSKIVATYSYADARGREAFQVCRMEPKSFRQRHQDSTSKWVWSMEGVERVLYRLPEVMSSPTVAICEGEKDADTLTRLGYCGTCNVGGAGKWLDGYTESLKGKDVVIFGDNDDAGRKHVDLVFDSLAGKVKCARIVFMPAPSKDVSDYVSTFPSEGEAGVAIDKMVLESQRYDGAIKLPLYSMVEIEASYAAQCRQGEADSFALSKWLPSFRWLRPLVPGELAMIVANTGVGKTAILSSIAIAARPLPAVYFQFELPPELMFERLVTAVGKMESRDVNECYAKGDELGEEVLRHHFGHMLICSEPRLTVEKMEVLINKADLKLGQRPKLIILDYVQLVTGSGKSRYEKASQVAEDLKIMAKATRTIVIIASQIHRKSDDAKPEIGLHDAKDSGSLENSCGIVIGAWRDKKDAQKLTMRVLKATKGGSGQMVECNFDGPRMLITEREDRKSSREEAYQ